MRAVSQLFIDVPNDAGDNTGIFLGDLEIIHMPTNYGLFPINDLLRYVPVIRVDGETPLL
jgi:hypothetical protein